MWWLDTAGKPFMVFTTDKHGRLSDKDRATLEKVRTVAVVVIVAAPPCHRCVWAARMRGYARIACACETIHLPNMAGPCAREGAAARRERNARQACAAHAAIELRSKEVRPNEMHHV